MVGNSLYNVLFLLHNYFVTSGHGFPGSLHVIVFYSNDNSTNTTDFFINQLLPVAEFMDDYVNIELIPFGRAKSVLEDGKTQIQCDSGYEECYANMFQDCAFLKLPANRDKVRFVVCEMTTISGVSKQYYCVQRLGMSRASVDSCMQGDAGLELQLVSEEITAHFQIKQFPTVVINKMYSQEVQDNAMRDLQGLLCTILTPNPACARLSISRALDMLY
ncbi:gamma-interferon-inducible lysosomal thiol reductase isoform X1 [Plutella xylostella]|uniref:gamma-interferon-inducible lysosomal thiol reductase isoform X1 n=2 Tax=Plutella xylostella TaxID=51655 RepID=UPI002032F088|nr:gamma-interferon-inducible lysosomal thiol reductase isoform X1 [Plutella xylostella]